MTTFAPEIPRAWADEDVATFELPLARPEHSPQHVPEEYYYSLPVRTIWRSYPVYHPDREPAGYRERLLGLDPEIAFDESQLVTEEDWIAAGALVFRAPVTYDGPLLRADDVVDPAWYEANEIALTSEGIFPYAHWVVREKGKLELGAFSCAGCHTRLMPDGSLLEGAQGTFPLNRILARRIRAGSVPLETVRYFSHALSDAPWRPSGIDAMTPEELAAQRAAIPAGVMPRQGASHEAPARTADLIGIRDRKYLDATGLVRHRGIGDVMRYAASNQGMDMLARFGDFVPAANGSERPPPGRSRFPGTNERYGDAQLYALALFLYSLEPPPSPHPYDDRARRGQEVFTSEGCASCHPPPLYTNNMLVPAPGFDPPADHYERYDVSRRRVGTDARLATDTRRGTGYYKVPSLKGLWYRGPYGHSGELAALEDWFDPRRTGVDYTPTGFAPADGGPRPVEGHLYGLDLSEEDKQALIAFLLTL